ncbi:MAG: adenylate/guanylate cyclase domain-containing protein [Planctomycetota bacterium]|nr:MAG: adenylate/guanylate cyclase domain-containing protein [Planctomycetota bacterium]
MLLTGIPAADAAAVVSLEGDRPDSETLVRLEHWDRRLSASGEFQPSRGLILDACRSGRSVVHIWRHTHDVRPAYTARQDIDWAACTPVLLEGKPRWALYVAGNFRRPASELSDSTTHDLREDVKFLELTAGIFAAVQRIRALERRETVLSRFLSPVILESIAGENPDEILSPRETEVTVIFSDLRGFSLETERWSDNLLKLLARVGDALGVMTRHILDNGGVIGDFQGDAAMGFWGWPIEQDDRIASAAKAALGMRREFESRANSTSEEHATFRVGIGIATGRAVAGKIGTADHAKVSVFGPVVNLASRLEGMTKLLHAPVLLDEATARLVRETVPSEVARVRRLASVRPYGMDASLVVSELVPPYHEFPLLNETHLRCCDEAVEAFIAGDWNTAYDLLRRMPSEDRGTDFLMVHIAQHNRTPPDDWDGAVRLAVK